LEVAVPAVVAQQRIVLLQREREQRLDLVQRQQDRVASGLRPRLERGQRTRPVGP